MSTEIGTAEQGGREDVDTGTTRVSALISILLRWGVRVSLALLFTGAVLGFTTGTAFDGSVAQLTNGAAAFRPAVPWLLHGLASGQATALIVLGLLLLIATPVLRVLLSLAFFAKQGDSVYVLITASVLALLILSFIFGKAVSDRGGKLGKASVAAAMPIWKLERLTLQRVRTLDRKSVSCS